MNDRNTFASTSYASAAQRDQAKCEIWLTADGAYNAEMVREFFNESTDQELAREMLNDWPDEYLTTDEAAEIFADLRADHWLDD